jgi:LacI family transcriptional regulator
LAFSPEDYILMHPDPARRREVLQGFMRERLRNYSALFFISDYSAASGINLFQDEGLRVPEDISVAGFDDNIYALTVRPRLTTIRQDVSQKAYFAVRQALRLIRKEPVELEAQICLPVSLVVRDSVKKLD